MNTILERLKVVEELFTNTLTDIKKDLELMKKKDADDTDNFEVEGLFKTSLDNNIWTMCNDKIKFKDLINYNSFLSRDTAARWSKKINAQLKLRLIAEHLNAGWKPDWKKFDVCKYFITLNEANREIIVNIYSYYNSGYTCFKTQELAQKAIEMMGDQIHDLFLEQ